MKTILILLALASSAIAQQKPIDDAGGKKLLESVCGRCHDLNTTTDHRATHDEWMELVERMVQKGASATDDQLFAIVDYLTRHYGPAKLKINLAVSADIAAFFSLSPADADAVVNYRTAHGNFKSVDDIAKSGVDRSKIEAKKDAILF